MPLPPRFLAIETSTDMLSLALGTGAPGEAAWTHQGPGGAQSSITLLPQVQALLGQAGCVLNDLEALVFGRGPGSFTGLRTACAVAQGLAYGSRNATHPQGLPVLAVDTLLALAEQARHEHATGGGPAPRHIVALLDARMDEMYAAVYGLDARSLHPMEPPCLCAPQDLAPWLAEAGAASDDTLLAGNVFDVYAERLQDLPGQRVHALPTADALLRLAPGLLAAGAAVAAADALPLYVRDKVARTTAEREGAP